ncbi:MAG: DUF3015 protein [Magnetococcales bacterium]|nr:DUF3015 protein [Magnetococcales bacterium]
MKLYRILIAASLMAASSSVAWADNDIGCGLGTQVMEGKSGVVWKVLGLTTNGVSSQLFAVSSGTSGCGKNDVITASNRLNMFTGANLDKLSAEMAMGQGETLSSMAAIMGIEQQDQGAFFNLTKNHYGQIFPSSDVTAGQVLTNINKFMAADQRLAVYVKGA